MYKAIKWCKWVQEVYEKKPEHMGTNTAVLVIFSSSGYGNPSILEIALARILKERLKPTFGKLVLVIYTTSDKPVKEPMGLQRYVTYHLSVRTNIDLSGARNSTKNRAVWSKWNNRY